MADREAVTQEADLHHFYRLDPSVWVISGPSATAEHIANGIATARSLGVAGCGRDTAGCPPAQLEP